MKTYSKVTLKFTKSELIQQLAKWKFNLTDLFDEDKIELGIKVLALNKLGIDFVFSSDAEFSKIKDNLNIAIIYYFSDNEPEGELINFDFCEVEIEIFPEEQYLNRAVIEN